MADTTPTPQPESSAHLLLQRIKNGLLDPKTLSKFDRQMCVEALLLEGHQASAMSQLLQKTDRTVRRDIQEIWQRNALSPNFELAKELVGEFLLKARTHHSYLMRLARSKEATIQEKINAESMAFKVQDETTKRLQSIGFLPSRPTEILANFFHHDVDDDKSIDEVKTSLVDLEEVMREAGVSDEDAKAKIEALRVRIEKTEVLSAIKKIKTETIEKEEKKENQSESSEPKS